MKKAIAGLLSAAVCLTAAAIPAAAADSADITVTLANAGTLEVIQESVTVSDTDGDGTLTVHDALYAAHEAFYEGGAAAGYAAEETQWGLSIKTLWGNTNGGSYMYTINDIFANSLTDPVKDGDRLYAYAMKDAAGYSDVYTFFDQASVSAELGEPFTLTLTANTFDENFSPVTKPVAGAKIIVDDEVTDIVTDAEGKAEITVSHAGKAVISAVSDSQILVPPAAVAEIHQTVSADITVSISDAGEAKVVQKPLNVKDTDGDGTVSVNEALTAAHDAFYDGGAAAGYAAEESAWGLSVKTLWGDTNGGSYMYAINNAFANSLADPLKDGDFLYAYAMADTETYSDLYTFFDKSEVTAETGEAFTLTLSALTFDASFTPVTVPVEGAVITADGEKTAFVTDADGKVTVTLDREGSVLLSAVSDSQVLVPAAVKAQINGAAVTDPSENTPADTGSTDGSGAGNVPAPQAGDAGAGTLAVTAVLMLGAAFALRRRHEN